MSAIERALRLLQGGDLAGADREIGAALSAAPDNPGLLRLQAWAAMRPNSIGGSGSTI